MFFRKNVKITKEQFKNIVLYPRIGACYVTALDFQV